MVEHVNILDADRHEPKGASTAATNQVLHSDGDGTTTWKFVDYNNLVNVPVLEGYQQVLSGFSSAASQQPSAVDTPLQIEFGAGTVTTDATLASNGTLTFNTAGDYSVSLFLRFGRTSGVGTSIILNRFLINDVQGLNSNAVKLNDADIIVPFSTSLIIAATAGMTFKLQIARDSGGINNGGVFRVLPTTLAWNLAPSATIVVSKFIGSDA